MPGTWSLSSGTPTSTGRSSHSSSRAGHGGEMGDMTLRRRVSGSRSGGRRAVWSGKRGPGRPDLYQAMLRNPAKRVKKQEVNRVSEIMEEDPWAKAELATTA